ncbi:hypothetical protein Glove_43g15 [Diversispora epigaea]|uniref:Uncharacterized protein n=1 Tax=Diversispora epigaea TaxID=1348612 RepID=A0A397JQV0_9GLOM|nr:hypothetical protein Glove_43g15 [Diversispora epigaea]
MIDELIYNRILRTTSIAQISANRVKEFPTQGQPTNEIIENNKYARRGGETYLLHGAPASRTQYRRSRLTSPNKLILIDV